MARAFFINKYFLTFFIKNVDKIFFYRKKDKIANKTLKEINSYVKINTSETEI